MKRVFTFMTIVLNNCWQHNSVQLSFAIVIKNNSNLLIQFLIQTIRIRTQWWVLKSQLIQTKIGWSKQVRINRGRPVFK